MKFFNSVFFLILINLVVFSQPNFRDRDENPNPRPIYLEANVFPLDSSYICYVSYRVSYNNLVFVKKDDVYTGGLTVAVEASSKNGISSREISEDMIEADNYDETLRNDLFLQGLLSFKLHKGRYTLNPLITIENTDRQIPLKSFNLDLSKLVDKTLLRPIAFIKSNNDCDINPNYKLANFEYSIPFGQKNYGFIIPVYNKEDASVTATISQYDDEIIKDENVNLDRDISLGLQKCKEQIYISNDNSTKKANLYKLNDFADKLREGPFTIEIVINDSLKNTYHFDVVWVDKPRTLQNPEFAYNLLEIIADPDTLSKILSRNDSNYKDALVDYWSRFNHNNKSGYNELMAEFYKRADYALKKFATPGNKDGTSSDRGRIYIKYGKPQKIDRIYDDNNETKEIWKYPSLNLEFVFVDQTGLGNYQLVN